MWPLSVSTEAAGVKGLGHEHLSGGHEGGASPAFHFPHPELTCRHLRRHSTEYEVLQRWSEERGKERCCQVSVTELSGTGWCYWRTEIKATALIKTLWWAVLSWTLACEQACEQSIVIILEQAVPAWIMLCFCWRWDLETLKTANTYYILTTEYKLIQQHKHSCLVVCEDSKTHVKMLSPDILNIWQINNDSECLVFFDYKCF